MTKPSDTASKRNFVPLKAARRVGLLAAAGCLALQGCTSTPAPAQPRVEETSQHGSTPWATPLKLLVEAPSLTLYSLQPYIYADSAAAPTFHDYKILGSIKLEGETQKTALAAMQRSITPRGPKVRCFDPRHGFRGELSGKTVDLVICFDCLQMLHIAGAQSRTIRISSAAKDVLNELLDRQGVVRDIPSP